MQWTRRGKVLATLAGVCAAGAAWAVLRERRPWTPAYRVDEADGAIERRDYPAVTVAETVQPGKRDRALGNGFGVLADYVLGGSRGGEELAHSVPVIADRAGANGWRVRFAMPDGDLPAPGDGVAIGTIPARAIAAIRFAGAADDRLLAAREAELRSWAAARGLTIAGPAEHAFYNSPLEPGRARRTEVWLPLA